MNTAEELKMYGIKANVSEVVVDEGGMSEVIVQPFEEFAGGARVVVFGLPGAFTPTCTKSQLPQYEEMYDQFMEAGVEDVFVTAVNDAYVMGAWLGHMDVNKVSYIADGNGELAGELGMLVDKSNLGFGKRSWRYAAVINEFGEIEQLFEEEGKGDNIEGDPYKESKPERVLEYLRSAG